MELYLHRLSLKGKANLFSLTEASGNIVTRSQWIAHYFSHSHAFIHRRVKFSYIPEREFPKDGYERLLFGWVARETFVSELSLTSEGVRPTERLALRAALIIVDPTDHQDGQKVAMEYNVEVGQPWAVVKSIAAHMSNEIESPYTVQSFEIVETGSFWRFAEENGNSIRRLTLDVAVPNMFHDKNDFIDEMKFLSHNENVSRVKTALISDSQLNLESDRMRSIVDYTESGAGEIDAKATNGAVYKSGDHSKKVDIEAPRNSGDLYEFFDRVLRGLRRIF